MLGARARGQVARASDFGRNDRTLFARTHLGHLLHAGDTALGYDLAAANVADAGLEAAMERGLVLPDVVLVRPALGARGRVTVGSAYPPWPRRVLTGGGLLRRRADEARAG